MDGSSRPQRGFTTRVHDEGSRRGFTTRVHDEGSRRGFTTRVHVLSQRCDRVRAERAGRLGATSELRDSGSLKTTSERVHRRRPGFVSGVRHTSWPNRLGADVRISQAGDAAVSTRRGEVVFPRSEAGAPRRPARSARTNGRETRVQDLNEGPHAGSGRRFSRGFTTVGSRRGFTRDAPSATRSEPSEPGGSGRPLSCATAAV